MSGGPFSTTRVDSGGIILPSLVYRNIRRKRRRHEPKEKVSSSAGTEPGPYQHSEILDVVKLLEKSHEKFIFEERRQESEEMSEDSQSTKINGNERQQAASISLFTPLEAAYHPNNVVPDVWASENSGVNHLYRYTNLDRLVYPPGMLFNYHD